MNRTTKQISIIVLAVSIAMAFGACNHSAKGDASNEAVAATVNGRNIPLSEVDRLISQQAKGQQAQLSPLENAAARLQVLDTLIQQEVLFQRAEKEKQLPTEDEVTQAINEQKQQNRMTEEEYLKYLHETNQTEQALRETARKQLAIKKLEDKTANNIKISDKDVEEFYNNNKGQFVNSRGVGLAAIIVDPADNGLTDDAKGDAAAIAKINNIYQQLKSGADFATVARAKSEDQNTSLSGGDIGFFTEDRLKQSGFPQDLITQFFGPQMQVGDITKPIKTSDGRWSIFKLTSKRLQSENLTLDSPGVRDQIKDALLNQHRSLLNAALLEVAMSEAKIENRLAANMLNSSDLGARPAQAPAQGNTAPSPAAKATPAGTTASPSPAASPAAKR